MDETMTLSTFAAQLRYEMLPPQVVRAAKNCILDYLGCAIFATQTDMGKIITEFCREGNNGSSTILPGGGGWYDASFAALANGTCAHGFELDDINLPSISHPGAPVIAAALALGEERGVDGKRLIEAVTVGYELMARTGTPIADASLARGYHPTGTFGTFGATAAACKILNLDGQHTAWALGLAGSLASGLGQFSISGSMVKRLHAGKAAQQGVIAAKLAERGFTEPTDILEGKLGFCRAYRGDMDPQEIDWSVLTDGLGQRYAIQETTVKPSAACGVLHAVIECIQTIRQRMQFEADEVQDILVKGHRNLVSAHNVTEPNSILAAQYSLPFTVGMCLNGDIEDPSPYLSDAILRDPGVLATGRKVRTELNPELDRLFPAQFGARVVITLKDGRTAEETVYHQKGSAGNPFTQAELERKYRKLAGSVLQPAEVDAMCKNVEKLEALSDVGQLLSGLQ